MYLIQHIKKYNFYKNKIAGNLYHFVFSEKDAHKFKSKKDAQKVLENFNHSENFEIIKYKCIR